MIVTSITIFKILDYTTTLKLLKDGNRIKPLEGMIGNGEKFLVLRGYSRTVVISM